MKTVRSYARTVSLEEAQKGYVFVLKNRLSFFPHRGKPFELSDGTQTVTATVESYRCECQGPQLPHDHFFIRWPGLTKGKKVEFTKTPKGEYRVMVK